MRQPARPVTVSIVSHGHWGHIQPLLQQLNTWCAPWIGRVILTLNVPERLCLDANLAFPVEVVHNQRPRGFGSNHNSAFARADTDWFLVMNPDLRIDRDVIGSLLSRTDTSAGLIAPRIQEPGCSQPEPYRTLVTPAELMRRRQQDHIPPEIPSWIAGMFMLLRTSAFRDIKGFDERFFMYCEDVDLCVRLQLAGWNLAVVTDVIVTHEAQRQSHTSFRAFFWHLTSFAKLWTSDGFWKYLKMQRAWKVQMQSPYVLLCRAEAAAAADQERNHS